MNSATRADWSLEHFRKHFTLGPAMALFLMSGSQRSHAPRSPPGRPDRGPWGITCAWRTGGSSGKKRPFCDILSQLKLILMHSSALEPPCGARSYELDQKIPAVRRPSKKPLE